MPPGQGDKRRRRWRALLALYVTLLVLSHVVAWLRRAPEGEPEAGGALPPGVSVFQARAARGAERGDEEISVAYRTLGEQHDGTPLVLLHGSPGDGASFGSLAEPLARGRRLIIPDMPGFGWSASRAPDYSVEAHADYVLQLLDELELQSVDLLAFSMGGGVAAHVAARAPGRVRSMAFVAAIGVQETELFGSHLLNHAVHGLQLAAIQGALWLLPHFGELDGFPLGIPYARNFYDTDQRPLRDLLGRFEGPMLIVHGERDFLVMPETAHEHHRIVPQSELAMLDTSHFLIWTIPDRVAAVVEDFLARTERGETASRGDAGEERLALARAPWDPANAPRFEGPALLLAFLLLAAATLVSEDLTCIGAGLLVAQGRMGFVVATLACFAGIFVGDLLLYLAGRWLGRPALARRPLRWFVTPAGVARATQWFQARGARVIFLSRFLPGLRLPTYVAAGILRMRVTLFALYFLLAGLLWTPILVGAATLVGKEALEYLESFERWALPAFLLLAFSLLAIERLVVPMFSFRGRRLLLGAWRRKRHFEFWHPLVFYLPVALYVAWLALRHRSLTVITAANPGIPTGGFIGESKADILDQLAPAGTWVARFRTIRAEWPAGRRREAAESFLAEQDLTFPVVLKPDVGQRGSGVRILRDRAGLHQAVDGLAVDCVLQEYVDGPEFGVFYVRRPGEERGSIFSITEKRLPAVVGDGESTLEELILADERAVCAASTYFDANVDRLGKVPAAGDEVRLVQLGTHCRGAVFLDGHELVSPELEARFEEISRTFDGFWFGRYDVRTESREALRAGRGFKILELNGLTSEATHIYDPTFTLGAAYRTLFEQWRLAFEIGAANRDRGAPVSSIGELVRAWLEYRRQQRTHPPSGG